MMTKQTDGADAMYSITQRRLRILGWVILFFALITVAQGLYLNARTADIVQCNRQYIEEINSSLAARDEASAVDRKAVDVMVNAVVTAKSGEDVRKALLAYGVSRQEADKARAENPFPVVQRCE